MRLPRRVFRSGLDVGGVSDADTVKLTQDHGYTDNPAWTPKMNTAFGDMLTNVIKKGADPAAEIAKAEKTVNAELSRLFG